MLYAVLKSLHVLGAVLFLGTGLGSAWYMLRADLTGDLRRMAWVHKEIVLADWVFTVPSGVLLPATGLWMALAYNVPLTTPWIAWGIGLYAVAGLCWVPAAVLQIRMARMIEAGLKDGLTTAAELDPAFERARLWWLGLGFPAFLAAAATVWVMVSKLA
jgi:uncharacterized membrane protein